jgi:hypothetical protein
MKEIEVIVVQQFYENLFIGKDYDSIPEVVYDEKYKSETYPGYPIAQKKMVVDYLPGWDTCWLRPDKNGKCYVYKHDWDSSD